MTGDQNQLIASYLDGSIKKDELKKLELLLDQSNQARSNLRLLAAVDEGLSDYSEKQVYVSNTTPISTVRPASKLKTFLPWVITTAACLVLMSKSFNPLETESPIEWSHHNQLEFPQHVMALLMDQAGAMFRSHAKPEDGVRFTPGEYHLVKGAIHIRMASGVDLLMRGPVEFKIENSMRVQLLDGNVKAVVPPCGQGFVITSQDIDYEDIGTEFCVIVDRQSETSELHVLDGEVNVRKNKTSTLLKAAVEGDSIRYEKGVLSDVASVDPNAFVAPYDIGYERWKTWSESITANSGMIAHYDFQPLENNDRILNNLLSKDGTGHGIIAKDMTWVRGRWPNKKALLFDQSQDHVKIPLPGQYPNFSISLWLKAEKPNNIRSYIFTGQYKEELSSFFINTSYNFYLFSSRQGINNEIKQKVKNNPFFPLEWNHLALVSDQANQKIDIYLNGRVERHAKFMTHQGINCDEYFVLGNHILSNVDPDYTNKALHGRIDELLIWDRNLKSEEIADLYQQGQPNKLTAYVP